MVSKIGNDLKEYEGEIVGTDGGARPYLPDQYGQSKGTQLALHASDERDDVRKLRVGQRSVATLGGHAFVALDRVFDQQIEALIDPGTPGAGISGFWRACNAC